MNQHTQNSHSNRICLPSMEELLFKFSKIIHPFASDKKMTSTEKYEEYIRKCSRKKLSDIIEHYSLAHGRLIVKHLIEFATKHKLPICMISGLYEEFWSPLTDSLSTYFHVNTKASLDIIIVNPYKTDLNNNSVYNFLYSTDLSSKVKIYEGIDKRIITSQPHFFLVGEEAYRKERSQNRAVTTASFNDPSNGKRLLETFNFISDDIKNHPLVTQKTTQPLLAPASNQVN